MTSPELPPRTTGNWNGNTVARTTYDAQSQTANQIVRLEMLVTQNHFYSRATRNSNRFLRNND